MPFGVLVRIQSWAQILNPVVKHWIFFYFPNQTCLNEVEIKKNTDLHRRWISYLCIEKTFIDHQTKEFTTGFDNPVVGTNIDTILLLINEIAFLFVNHLSTTKKKKIFFIYDLLY